MPPSNSRYTKDVIDLCETVATAIGYRASKSKKNKGHYDVHTPDGTCQVKAKSAKDAIRIAAPDFTESQETVMLNWLGRQAVQEDFGFKIEVTTPKGKPACWKVVVADGRKKKVFKSRSLQFPAARPLAEAVAHVQKAIRLKC